MNFAIFRIGNKFKSIQEVKGFERHTERKQYTPNANLNIENEILIGSTNIAEDVERYIEGIKLRKNGVLARDLLLTTSPAFMQEATEELKEEWINRNIEWLIKEFGSNIIYAALHKDETTWHIHCLLVPKFYDSKRGRYTLSNRNYFNGKLALSEWQDKYSKTMEEFGLNRGLKWSKAKHTDIKTFYNLVNKEFKENEIDSLCAKAKNGELLSIKVKSLQKTLNIYKNYNQKSEEEKQEIKKQNINLFNQVKDIKKDKEIFKECIKTMSDLYKIPQEHIKKVLNYVTDKATDKEKGKDLELSKNN
ncbi:MobV family relaxase [Clostridium cylindrosporum]|uniref:Plasmid recombination enzyme n=1 Tax=Clostridium cylindrosporum DSM 605 TaxID=1121307 RepID=A0A0J8D8X7_CLOCY|nr:MobV family relaxase [Clostridium cylindrosporum]KMT22327.1 plasmid recombination enzyme [Clostridium cylindrosporum DSM 605]